MYRPAKNCSVDFINDFNDCSGVMHAVIGGTDGLQPPVGARPPSSAEDAPRDFEVATPLPRPGEKSILVANLIWIKNGGE